MEIYQDLFGNPIRLTFDPSEFRTPGHVLIVPFYKNGLVFTRQIQRGIELPGGKIEPGETPLAAAVREAYEETGASLSEIRLIGQYIITMKDEEMVKSIYTAQVAELLPLPKQTDTLGAVIFDEIPTDVKDRPEFSVYMKDAVYPRLLQYLGIL